MIYAAWFDLHNDDVIVAHPTALRVYAHLLRNPLVFMHAQDVKVWLIAERLRTHRNRVSAAIDLLAARGYILEHPRGANNVRRVQLLMERTPPKVEDGKPLNEPAPKSA